MIAFFSAIGKTVAADRFIIGGKTCIADNGAVAVAAEITSGAFAFIVGTCQGAKIVGIAFFCIIFDLVTAERFSDASRCVKLACVGVALKFACGAGSDVSACFAVKVEAVTKLTICSIDIAVAAIAAFDRGAAASVNGDTVDAAQVAFHFGSAGYCTCRAIKLGAVADFAGINNAVAASGGQCTVGCGNLAVLACECACGAGTQDAGTCHGGIGKHIAIARFIAINGVIAAIGAANSR